MGSLEYEQTAKFKSKKFAVRIVNLYKYLGNDKKVLKQYIGLTCFMKRDILMKECTCR